MTDYLNTREPGKMFTDAEFRAIPRDSAGDIVDLYDAYAFIAERHREQLSEDDWSRMIEYDEESAIMMAEFLAEQSAYCGNRVTS
jgi:hypothetical protein